jgi:hypothetical protein
LIRALLLLTLLPLACGGEPVGTVRIPLTSPEALDPSLIDQVEVVAVEGSTTRCVLGAGSNTCNEIQSAVTALSSAGYIDAVTLRLADGSVATFQGLPHGRTCFVAEAQAAGGKPLALGCAEVELALETHRIEIVLSATP